MPSGIQLHCTPSCKRDVFGKVTCIDEKCREFVPAIPVFDGPPTASVNNGPTGASVSARVQVKGTTAGSAQVMAEVRTGFKQVKLTKCALTGRVLSELDKEISTDAAPAVKTQVGKLGLGSGSAQVQLLEAKGSLTGPSLLAFDPKVEVKLLYQDLVQGTSDWQWADTRELTPALTTASARGFDPQGILQSAQPSKVTLSVDASGTDGSAARVRVTASSAAFLSKATVDGGKVRLVFSGTAAVPSACSGDAPGPVAFLPFTVERDLPLGAAQEVGGCLTTQTFPAASTAYTVPLGELLAGPGVGKVAWVQGLTVKARLGLKSWAGSATVEGTTSVAPLLIPQAATSLPCVGPLRQRAALRNALPEPYRLLFVEGLKLSRLPSGVTLSGRSGQPGARGLQRPGDAGRPLHHEQVGFAPEAAPCLRALRHAGRPGRGVARAGGLPCLLHPAAPDSPGQ